MRFMFKTDYEDDIRLFPHSGYVVSYGVLLALLAIAPFVLSSYLVSQLVFVCIYATVGVGLMILTGFTGQASLGHAAFLAIGAYTAAYLQQYNVPFPVYFLAAGLLLFVGQSALSAEANWPGWRGPEGNGHSTETGLPVRWDAKSVVWKTPLKGKGNSTPII